VAPPILPKMWVATIIPPRKVLTAMMEKHNKERQSLCALNALNKDDNFDEVFQEHPRRGIGR